MGIGMEFYNSKSDFHLQARQSLKEMIHREQIFHWYKEFFGYYPANFKMYLALYNGSCSYGYPVFYPDGEVEFVSLIGARFPDGDGVPTYPKDWFLPLEFKELGVAMLVTQRAKMIEHGYNVWNVIIQEYIVRACTIVFLEQFEGKRAARRNIESFLLQIKNYFENYLNDL
jgi:hypothetical protein